MRREWTCWHDVWSEEGCERNKKDPEITNIAFSMTGSSLSTQTLFSKKKRERNAVGSTRIFMSMAQCFASYLHSVENSISIYFFKLKPQKYSINSVQCCPLIVRTFVLGYSNKNGSMFPSAQKQYETGNFCGLIDFSEYCFLIKSAHFVVADISIVKWTLLLIFRDLRTNLIYFVFFKGRPFTISFNDF